MKHLLYLLAVGCTELDLEPTDPLESVTRAAVSICPSGTWCTESPPQANATTSLRAVWAVTADDVFAVGDAGTILRRINDTWSAMASGTAVSLRGVWAASSSDVWATGQSGTVLHFDGTAWSPVATIATSEVSAVSGSSSNDVWFVGSETVLHWNGSAFSSTGFSGPLLAVSTTSPSDVWVTGENTMVHHWDGAAWTLTNPGAGTNSFFALLAIAPNDVWVASGISNRETSHWNGVRWTSVPATRTTFNSMSALGTSDIWGAGNGGRVGHWNGAAWTIDQAFSTSTGLRSVTTVPGNAWIVGDGGLIAHRSL